MMMPPNTSPEIVIAGMRALKITLIIIIVCLLTVLTQTGGLVYLLSRFAAKRLLKRINALYMRVLAQAAMFAVFYLTATFLVVPVIAKPLGRVPLPVTQTGHLRPLTFITYLLNRNYVRPQLKETAFTVAEKMNTLYPGTVVNYLDACFPFINKFPLFPHLSHNDGKKMDLAFFYKDASTGVESNTAPSPIGYGVCEEPTAEEVNTADICASQGYRMYSLLKHIVPQGRKQNFLFDAARTKALVNLFAIQSSIGKIFIEPHLKMRLHLNDSKVRFQGCHAVRHDDHVHIQLY